MAHIPTTATYLQKVIRIAKELDISIDKASITGDAFELAFSDPPSRQAIFGMIEQLDKSAAGKGEPLGLIINYGVEIGLEGIRVSRYADEIPAGEVVTLTPPDQACIFLQIKDDFPTQEVLGPMIVDRPAFESVPRAIATGDLPENRKSQIQNPKSNDGVVCADSDMAESEVPNELPSEWGNAPICLGPIRLKFDERFPFVSADGYRSKRQDSTSILISDSGMAPKSAHHLPQSAALQAGMFALQSSSGLSPPTPIGECGHSASKDVHRHWHISRDMRLTSGSLTIWSSDSPPYEGGAAPASGDGVVLSCAGHSMALRHLRRPDLTYATIRLHNLRRYEAGRFPGHC